MKSVKLFLSLAVVVLLGACAEKTRKIHCHIEGTVPDSTYTMMLLAPSGSDFRVVDADSIPVIDGKFAFDLYVDEVMPYDLISMEEFNHGSWYTCVFFAEEGVVDITFHHSERDAKAPSFVSVSPTNKRYLQYIAALQEMTDPLKHEADSLKKVGKWNTPRMMKLETEFREAKDDQTKLKLAQEASALSESGEAFTPEYHAFQAKSKMVREERDKYIEDFIRSDRTVIGLYLLRHKVLRNRDFSKELPLVALFTEVYQPLFPNHPLSKQIEEWIQSLGIKVGNRYIDFTAPALDGTLHTLSKEIGGKIALIDLWASWCGSCRRTSKSMIPLYEKYKERGFTVVGVARESKREDMERALARDGYPWLNLLELQDEHKIWEKYGVSRAGGITVLVDRDGTILAIHPTAEEVERILQEKL
ncbi:MAG: AhpC/TSA family protein [Bacteroidaceae bacterium]|nr:AhpC/TSA family protein [Bacteroidaceae bacterium]